MGKIVSFLWILTPIASTISVIIVWVAMATSDWIRTQERILNLHYNGSTDHNKYILKMTYSGIWEICAVTVADGDTKISCQLIEYFASDPYYPDPIDSSFVIPYAVRQSVFFFVVAGLVQLFGELGYLYGHYVRDRKVFVFIGGTIFIVSGLVMLIGIVMYISIFKTEVSAKLKASSASQSFNFQYGVSFLLYVSGFIGVELSGTCAVLLFVYHDQTVHSVHFIHASPVIYDSYNSTTSRPAVGYPCRVHSELCLAMDSLSYNAGHLYPTDTISEPIEMTHRCYVDQDDSPPYGPASRMSSYEDDEEDEKKKIPVLTQSATTQTVSIIYDPNLFNETATATATIPETLLKKAPKVGELPSASHMELFRKSTLV